jgi:tetratricopeptide (TPR) repeat protein
MAKTSSSEERFKNTIAVVMAIIAALIAVLAFLQSDAAARDDRANRDSKRYATEALGRKVSGDARVNFDYNTAYQSYYELDLLANSAEARGETAEAKRYQTLRDRTLSLSPLLAAPYFDLQTGEVDLAKYEVDTYLIDITVLTEKFVAASRVKDGWDAKANTYIVHLTLLAVALFMFGLSITIGIPATRIIFVGMGTLTTLIAIGWAAAITLQPVPDLRDRSGAIEAYARGVGLAYQLKFQEAVTAFDEALKAAPDYAAAFAARAATNMALSKVAESIGDFEQARANGDDTSSTGGDLAEAYYLAGRFEDSIKLNREILAQKPDELWIRFNLAIGLLAFGQIDAAQAEYAAGMKQATDQVAAAQAAKQAPPYDLWWSLDNGANTLDDLTTVIESQQGAPPLAKIVNPSALPDINEKLVSQLKSLAVSLEFTGLPPASALTAKVSPFVFGEPVIDANGSVTDYKTGETFAYGTQTVSVLFDYESVRDGQETIFKVYINGEEDPSWRIIEPWALGASGSAQKPLSVAYSDTFVLGAGIYEIELYIDGQLAQRGSFVIEKP